MVPLVLVKRTLSARKNCLICCHLVFSREDLEVQYIFIHLFIIFHHL